MTDISKLERDSRESIQTLRESEELYKALVKASPDAIMVTDLRGIIIDASERAVKLSGARKIDDLIGISAFNFIASKDHKRAEINLKKTLTEEQIHNIEYTFLKVDKTEFIGEMSAGLIKDSKGKPKAFIGIIRDITERKKAEKALLESEAKYRSLYETALTGLWTVKLQNGVFLRLNKISGYILGFNEIKNIINKISIFDFFDRKTYNSFLNKLKKEGEISGFETHFRDINNVEKDVSISAKIYEDKGIIEGVFVDISDLKKTEKALTESQEKFKTLTEQSLMGICIIQDDKIKYVNKRLADLFGYTINEMKNWATGKFAKAIHPEDMNFVVDQIKKKECGDSNVKTHYEFRGIKKTGQIVWVDNYSKTITYRGRPADFITIIDITEKRKAEEKLKESEEKYRSILENIKEAYFEVDLKGDFIFVNNAFCEIIGYSRDEIIGMNFSQFVDKTNKEKLFHHYNNIYLSGIEQVNFEYEAIKKNGKKVYIDTSAYLRYDKNGNKVGFYGLCRDITEKKKAEILIKEEIRKLKDLDQIRKDLISRVSHELKTPLATVLGASELLLTLYKGDLLKDQIELIKIIEKGGNRLKQLVENLLDVSRIEYKVLKLDKKKHDFCEIIKECVQEVAYLFRKRKINFKLKLPKNMFLKVDKIRIEQVITNLLTNAIKNTPPDGDIVLSLEKYGNWAIMSVTDTGIGFTNEEIKKIFFRFGKLERHGPGLEYIDIQGTGLGLFISKEITALHGGKIWVESEGRHKGSIFTIRLPIK
ncbi:MAG: PAS domain-containing sensor histidine kinase [Promethearchaeota archaeon]